MNRTRITRLIFILGLVTLALMPVAANAQGAAGSVIYQAPVIAFVGSTGDVSITSMGVNPGTARLTGDARLKPAADPPFFAQDNYYTNLRWSPDGNDLLFTTSRGDLYIARSGQPSAQIASSLAPLPAVWSLDGKEIAYGVATSSAEGGGTLVAQVQAIPANGGAPRFATQFTMYCGAGGIGVYDPAEALYMQEMGAINGDFTVLDWTAAGFVHSTGCLGEGLALSDSAGNLVWTIPNIYHAVVSPDRSRAVAMQGTLGEQASGAKPTPVIIDLATGGATPITTQPDADQFGWTADGLTVLYSTLTPLAQVAGDPNSAVGKQLFFNWPLTAATYTVSLWRVPATGGDSTLLFSQEGRAIGHIAASPLTPVVTFSFIESSGPFFQAINAGKSRQAALAAMPKLQIGVTTLNPGQGMQAGYPYFFDGGHNGQPAFSRAGVFTAVPAAGMASVPTQEIAPTSAAASDCFNNLPARMVIGKLGRVLPGTPNSLNSLPARPTANTGSSRVGLIPGGGVFTVLDGPVCADGYRWWKVNYNNLIGWTAEGEGSVYWIEPLP